MNIYQIISCRVYADDDWYTLINGYLRGNNIDIDESIVIQHIKNIDSCMKPLESTQILYRGLKEYPIDGLQKAFTSTSTDIDIAKLYGDYILILEVPKGTPHINIENVFSIPRIDNEILLTRNIKIDIYKVDSNNFYGKLSY